MKTATLADRLRRLTQFRLHSDRQAPPETDSSFSIIDG
jgi:hypothetical protein